MCSAECTDFHKTKEVNATLIIDIAKKCTEFYRGNSKVSNLHTAP